MQLHIFDEKLTKFVRVDSPMFHANFKDHWAASSELNHLQTLVPPFHGDYTLNFALFSQSVWEKMIFENG